jgi:hypothetical protein
VIGSAGPGEIGPRNVLAHGVTHVLVPLVGEGCRVKGNTDRLPGGTGKRGNVGGEGMRAGEVRKSDRQIGDHELPSL